MAKTTDQLGKILVSGGGIIIEKGSKTSAQLLQLADAAKKGNTMIIIKGVKNLTTDELSSIAMKSQGHVVFDLS